MSKKQFSIMIVGVSELRPDLQHWRGQWVRYWSEEKKDFAPKLFPAKCVVNKFMKDSYYLEDKTFTYAVREYKDG